MARTDNEYWLWLESIRRSGIINMFESPSLMAQVYDMPLKKAIEIVKEWMDNYDRADYEGV